MLAGLEEFIFLAFLSEVEAFLGEHLQTYRLRKVNVGNFTVPIPIKLLKQPFKLLRRQPPASEVNLEVVPINTACLANVNRAESVSHPLKRELQLVCDLLLELCVIAQVQFDECLGLVSCKLLRV